MEPTALALSLGWRLWHLIRRKSRLVVEVKVLGQISPPPKDKYVLKITATNDNSKRITVTSAGQHYEGKTHGLFWSRQIQQALPKTLQESQFVELYIPLNLELASQLIKARRIYVDDSNKQRWNASRQDLAKIRSDLTALIAEGLISP